MILLNNRRRRLALSRSLRRRRTELIQLLANGYTLQQAARKMGIGYSTTREHAADLCRLNGNVSITGVVVLALAHEVIRWPTFVEVPAAQTALTFELPAADGRKSKSPKNELPCNKRNSQPRKIHA